MLDWLHVCDMFSFGLAVDAAHVSPALEEVQNGSIGNETDCAMLCCCYRIGSWACG